MIRILSILIVFVTSNAAASTWEILSGTIGKNLKIRMRLKIDGEAVNGGYFYTKSGQEIKLTGTLSGGLYTLTEYDVDKKSAQFIFSRASESEYSGSWYSLNKSSSKLPVKLVAENPEATAVLLLSVPRPFEFFHDTIKKVDKKFHYEIEVGIPQLRTINSNYILELFNASIKHELEFAVTEIAKDFKDRFVDMKEGDLLENTGSYLGSFDSITNTYPPIISLYFDQDFYPMGAAHPMHVITTKTYSTTEGKWLGINDLFADQTPYLDRLAGYCIRDLKQQMIDRETETLKIAHDTVTYNRQLESIKQGELHESIIGGTSPVLWNYRNFTISPEGLTIYFGEFQVASYLDGRFEVTIPFAEINDILIQNGELQEAIKR